LTTRHSIARYLNVRQAYGPSFAADGERLAFITNITGIPQAWQVPLVADTERVLWPEQLTFEPGRVSVVSYSSIAGDNRLVYGQDVGGSEKTQIYLLAEGGSLMCLTEGHEAAMHILGRWSDDGKLVLFAANRRHPGLFDLYLQPVPRGVGDGGESVEAQMVWQNDRAGYLYTQEIAPDGKHALVTRVASSFNQELLEIDLEVGTARRLLPAESETGVRITACQYASDGRSLLLTTDLDSDYLYVARLDLGSGRLETVCAPEWDCEAMTVSADGSKLAYAANVEGMHELHVLDTASGEELAAATASDLLGGSGVVADGELAFSVDGARLAFSFSSSTRTADIYVWELDADRMQAVTQSSHGGLDRERFVVPELIRFPTFDQDSMGQVRQIPAWFYSPSGARDGPRPAVVIVHGGPESQYRPGFDAIAQYLTAHGYAVLAPNVRGSTGYGKAYSHLDDVEKRMDSVADLAHAALWLKERDAVDGERIAVYGGSYGGFMVLSALTTYPELWAAGVDIVGISNLATFLENTSEYRRAHREAEYGSLAHDRAFLEEIAPIHHVDRLAAPLLVIHGANDPRVPLSEAEQLVAAVRDLEVPIEFLVFDDEGHGLVKLHNKQVAYPAVVGFLDQYLSR
jgi:dipeptidyl aminopeptidase/acylaminoacyl peptidase